MAKPFDPRPGQDYTVDPVTGCWLWAGPLSTGGYAIVGGRTVSRMMLERARGLIPLGHLACHTCDVRACINPDHLFAGTRGDNARDMSRKGRGSKRTALLDEVAVRQVLTRHYEAGETWTEIARDLAVPVAVIRNIVQGKSWRPVFEAFHGLRPWPEWPAEWLGHAAGAMRCAAIVRERREALGLTQAQLGKRLRLSGNFISLLESGRSKAPPNRVLGLARALEVNAGFLFEHVLAERDEFREIHAWLFGPTGKLRHLKEARGDP